MNKFKKNIIYISSGIICLAMILLLVNYFVKKKYRDQIPSLPDLTTLSATINEQLSLANSNANNNPTSENLGTLGMVYHSCTYYDLASQCYKLAIRKDKSKWIWHYYLAHLQLEMGDSRSAIENLNSVIKLSPKTYQVWYYLGKAYQNMTLVDSAEAAFNKIAYLDEVNSTERTMRVNYSSWPISAKFELARMYLNTNRLHEAKELLTSVIQKNHSIGPVYRLLGNVYYAIGDSLLSSKYIVRAQDLAEVTTLNDTLIDKLALLSRSELYLPKQIDDAMKSANPEWARQLFNQALMYLSDDKYLVLKAIKYFLRMDKGKNALPYLDKNSKNFSDSYNEISEVAELLYKKGFYEQAIPYFKLVKKLKPENNDFQKNFALSYWKTGKKDSAFMIMSELFEKNKNNINVLASEVDFMLKVEEKEKAEFFLSKLKQLAPSATKVLKFGGMIAEAEGNSIEALSLYEAAFKGDPYDMECTQKLVSILLDKKLWAKAIAVFRISLQHHPNEPLLLEKLGTLLITCPDSKLRNVNEGLELSERAFYHISSPLATLISAGKSLALGNVLLKDFKTANYYINITLNIAKSNNAPDDYMKTLLNLAAKIKQYRDN